MTTSPRGEVEEATADAYLWMSLLPSWLRAVFSCLYVPMLQPSDDALARFRKLFLAVSFVPGILVPLVFATLNAATLPSVATTSTTVVASVAPGLAVPYWVCIYWLARRGTFSAAAMSALWTYGTLLLALLLTLSCPDLPMDVLFVVLFVVALLLRVPFMPIAALMPFAGFVIASHNAAAYSRGDPDVPLLALPDVAVRAYAYRVASSGVALVAVLVIVAALYAQLSECDRQTSQAAATSALALAVAQRLGEYDTTGARAVLDETDGVTDEILRGAMKVLIDNLDKYRPHLPNWVVGDTEVPTHRLRAKVETDTVSLTSASSRRVGDHAMVPSTRSDRSSTGSDGVRSGWLRGGQAFESFASSVLMRFTVHDGRAFTPESSASMTAFVDTVHRLAGQTGGAVHSFVGDALSMSWNAASRVSQSEAKSVRMMARLKKAADAFCGKWHFVAAIQSGKMCVQLAGGVESRQQALTLTAPWSGENLHRIMQVASPLGHGVVCDHRTRIGAEHVATFRALAAASTTHDPRLGVYELLGEHEDGGEMEEWLYIMAKQQAVGIPSDGGDARLILDALDCWTKGDDVGASKLLNLDGPLSSETVSHAINTRCGRVATTASSS